MTALLITTLALLLVVVVVLVVLLREFRAHRTRIASAFVSAERQRLSSTRRVACQLDELEALLRRDESLIGKTVVIERAGHDVVNLRGVVMAEHADRLTLDQAHGIGPEGDVPLEHPVIHVPAAVVLSVSEVTG